MNIKYFYLLSGRCPKLAYWFSCYSRSYHSIKLNEKCRVLSHFIPVQVVQQSKSLIHLHAYFANQEKLSKESLHQHVVEIPSLQFEDVSFEKPVSHEDLITELQKFESIADQMECLKETLALSPEDIEKRVRFCKTIESLFQPFFKDFKIQMFGSTVNSFGFKGCDIDMTFETSAKHKDMSCYLERPDVPLISEVLSGKISLQELSELPPKEKLIFMHSVFLEHYKESETPAKFINAYVPLIRFYHDKFNLKCDLTMKNRVAYANTKLLYLYSKLDRRVKLLVMTIRYWAKHTELIGKGLMFNTYTITLLVIYFLQTRSPPVLPSAESVFALSANAFDTDMRDCSFLNILDNMPCSKNEQSLEELLEEFFFFYLYFDFTRVIRPLTASTETREEFFSKEENSRFKMNTICVQDPLCLIHNVAELVDYKHCRKFFNEIMVICKQFQRKKFAHPPGNINLITILNKPSNYMPHKVDRNVISINLPLINKGKNFLSHEQKTVLSAQTLLRMLEYVLLFDCRYLEFNEVLTLLEMQDKLISARKRVLQERSLSKLKEEDLIPHRKNRRKKSDDINEVDPMKEESDEEELLLEQFQKFNSDHKLVLCAECKVTKNVWVGRESIFGSLDLKSTSVSERFISECVEKQNTQYLQEKKMKPFVFLFECYISPYSSEDFLVNFRHLETTTFNPILDIFLKEYVTKFMKRINEKDFDIVSSF